MTPEQLDHFRQQLESLRSELLETQEAAKDATQTVVLDQASVGRLSRMDAMQGQAMALENNRRRELQLKRIASALRRIESDDYGYCIDCDDEISLGRLETDPTNSLCIDCASKREQR